MTDERTEYARALANSGYMPPEEYVRELARSARGAEEMRPRVIADVTTIAHINRARGLPPVRLVYSRNDGCGVPGEGEV